MKWLTKLFRFSRGEVPIDPSPSDWYRRGNEHLERGDRVRALKCWEEFVRLTSEPSTRANVGGLRSSLRAPEQASYAALNEQLEFLKQFSEKKRRLYMFNLPGLLGTEPVDKALLERMARG